MAWNRAARALTELFCKDDVFHLPSSPSRLSPPPSSSSSLIFFPLFLVFPQTLNPSKGGFVAGRAPGFLAHRKLY